MNDLINEMEKEALKSALDRHDIKTIWVMGMAAWVASRGQTGQPEITAYNYADSSEKLLEGAEGMEMVRHQVFHHVEVYQVDDVSLVWRMGLASWQAAQNAYAS